MDWDAKSYGEKITMKDTGHNAQKEADKVKSYPQLKGEDGEGMYVDRPCVVVDRHRYIIAWCVPDALTSERQVRPTMHSSMTVITDGCNSRPCDPQC